MLVSGLAMVEHRGEEESAWVWGVRFEDGRAFFSGVVKRMNKIA